MRWSLKFMEVPIFAHAGPGGPDDGTSALVAAANTWSSVVGELEQPIRPVNSANKEELKAAKHKIFFIYTPVSTLTYAKG